VVAVGWKGDQEVPLTKVEANTRLVVRVVAAVRKLEIAHQEPQAVHSHYLGGHIHWAVAGCTFLLTISPHKSIY